MYMRDLTSRKTSFHLKEYAGEHDRYDNSKLHPMQHTLIVVQLDGSERQISVGQLDIFLEYAYMHPNMGSALDSVYKAAIHKKEEEKCTS